MSVKTDNLNLNLNLNLAASAAAGGGGPRYNTEDFCKLTPAPFPAQIPLPTLPYSPNFDPEFKAWAYVEEFILKCTWGGKTPIEFLKDSLNAQNVFPVPDQTATKKLTPQLLSDQVLGVLNAALDRADRASEIVDQASGPGALNYWQGLMRIDPSQDRSAYQLMLVARKIGEYVVMGLKTHYKMRRPSQVYPLIMPIIDPPNHASFPSGHSLQSHFISGALKLALTDAGGRTGLTLDHLAERVARNREIAGVHYAMDSAAGKYVADICLAKLGALGAGLFYDLVAAAKGELKDLP